MFIKNKKTGVVKDVLKNLYDQLLATGEWEPAYDSPEQKATIKAYVGDAEPEDAYSPETEDEKIKRRAKKNLFKKGKK